jgi:hypothetical protein
VVSARFLLGRRLKRMAASKVRVTFVRHPRVQDRGGWRTLPDVPVDFEAWLTHPGTQADMPNDQGAGNVNVDMGRGWRLHGGPDMDLVSGPGNEDEFDIAGYGRFKVVSTPRPLVWHGEVYGKTAFLDLVK